MKLKFRSPSLIETLLILHLIAFSVFGISLIDVLKNDVEIQVTNISDAVDSYGLNLELGGITTALDAIEDAVSERPQYQRRP